MEFTETKVRYPNIGKMQQFYNWNPNVNLFDGISNTLNWFIDNYEEN